MNSRPSICLGTDESCWCQSCKMLTLHIRFRSTGSSVRCAPDRRPLAVLHCRHPTPSNRPSCTPIQDSPFAWIHLETVEFSRCHPHKAGSAKDILEAQLVPFAGSIFPQWSRQHSMPRRPLERQGWRELWCRRTIYGVERCKVLKIANGLMNLLASGNLPNMFVSIIDAE